MAEPARTRRIGDRPGQEPTVTWTPLRGIDLTIESGETFGFLGPNGAGKSTTISMLCTLVTPTAGSAKMAIVEFSFSD